MTDSREFPNGKQTPGQQTSDRQTVTGKSLK